MEARYAKGPEDSFGAFYGNKLQDQVSKP